MGAGLSGRLAGKHLIDGGAQILAGDRNSVAGAALVKLAAIDQAEAFIEKKEIRRAGGLVGMRHGLRSRRIGRER